MPLSARPPEGLSPSERSFAPKGPFAMSLAPAPSQPPIVTERPEDAPLVEALVLRAFGPGRYAKAAERLREGRGPLYDLSFVAWDGARLVGCAQQWTVKVGETPAIFFGPIAVDPAYRTMASARALIERACEAARGGRPSPDRAGGRHAAVRPARFRACAEGDDARPGRPASRAGLRAAAGRRGRAGRPGHGRIAVPPPRGEGRAQRGQAGEFRRYSEARRCRSTHPHPVAARPPSA